jgi:hypothetical protein
MDILYKILGIIYILICWKISGWLFQCLLGRLIAWFVIIAITPVLAYPLLRWLKCSW